MTLRKTPEGWKTGEKGNTSRNQANQSRRTKRKTMKYEEMPEDWAWMRLTRSG